MREENYILSIVAIVCLLSIVSISIIGNHSADGNPIRENSVGFAAHPLYAGFATAIQSFSATPSITFSSSDSSKNYPFSINDDAVYNIAYISIGGSAWQAVQLSGTTLGGSWLTGQAIATIAIPQNNIIDGTSSDNYIIIYSCTKNATAWDCHDNMWQLQTFNTSKNSGTQPAGMLLANGFENNGNLVYPFTGASVGSITPDKTYAHTGQYSFKQTAGATLSYTSPDCCSINSVVENVSGNQTTINLTAYVMSQSSASVGMTILCLDDQYHYWDSNGTYFIASTATSTNAWTKVSVNGICPSRTTHIAVRLENRGSNGTSVWWDDVSLLTTSISQQTTNTTMSCTGSNNQSCTIANGSGIQTRTCNTTTGNWGVPYGTCTVQSCNNRYIQSGNNCIAVSSNQSSNLTYPKAPTTLVHDQICSSDGKITVRADANKQMYLASRLNTGIAMFRLAWTDSVNPFNSNNQYIAPIFIENAIKNLSIPLTRDYHLVGEPGGVNAALDMMAIFANKEGIPQDQVILELELAYDTGSRTMMTPAQWAAAVNYSINKGYKFKIWEVSNEPQYAWGTGLEYPSNYSRHVMDVYDAIKAVQPDAIVGAEVNRVSWYSDQLLSGAKGHYDFIAGHFYAFVNSDTQRFEDAVLTENYRTINYVAQTNAKISTNNPANNNIYQMDTEWRIMVEGTDGDGEHNIRNGNMWGVLHAGVRMIYYMRDGYMHGATYWNIRGSTSQNIVPSGYDSSSTFLDGKYSLNYWLFYYMTHNTGDIVLNSSSTSTPCLTGTVGGNVDTGSSTSETYTGPQAPVMVTMSNDSRSIFVTIVNGNWTNSFPLEINITNYNVNSVSASIISGDGNLNGTWLCANKATCVGNLPLTIDMNRKTITGTMPAHSIAFVTIQ